MNLRFPTPCSAAIAAKTRPGSVAGTIIGSGTVRTAGRTAGRAGLSSLGGFVSFLPCRAAHWFETLLAGRRNLVLRSSGDTVADRDEGVAGPFLFGAILKQLSKSVEATGKHSRMSKAFALALGPGRERLSPFTHLATCLYACHR